MHELTLFGQVPLTRYEQVLNILAGLAAMQPQALYEKHSILQPRVAAETNKVNKKNPTKPVQPQTISYAQLIQPLSDDGDQKTDAVSGGGEEASKHVTASPSRLQTLETPEPEIKALALRKVTEVEVEADQVSQYSDPQRYRLVSQYVVEGQRLIHKNIVVSLYRTLASKPSGEQAVNSAPVAENLELVDKSGAMILEAAVRVDDRTKPSLLQAATEELLGFQRELRGVVDLRCPERLSLDTRVRNPT